MINVIAQICALWPGPSILSSVRGKLTGTSKNGMQIPDGAAECSMKLDAIYLPTR